VPTISGDVPETAGTRLAMTGCMIVRALIAPNPRSFGIQDE
jgi:hypothetical protein